jgi:hypothetical protein
MMGAAGTRGSGALATEPGECARLRRPATSGHVSPRSEGPMKPVTGCIPLGSLPTERGRGHAGER